MKGRVRPKKNLGQHFLTDSSVVSRIIDSIPVSDSDFVIEVGPGEGVLTEHLASRHKQFMVVEFDLESVDHLLRNDILNQHQIFQGDFLKWKLPDSEKVMIVGNFPYNISSQIVFKILDERDKVYAMVGMFQKEVAERICSGPGSKNYGILSVLTQVFYETEYLFTVEKEAFRPPPKVQSGVIKMTRKKDLSLPCSYSTLKSVVKMAFNQRRKMLRNSLGQIIREVHQPALGEYLTKRPEQLGFIDFITIASEIERLK